MNKDERYYMSSVKIGPKGQIVIPKEARDMFCLLYTSCIFEKGMVYCLCNRISMSKRIEQERCMAKKHTQRGIVR